MHSLFVECLPRPVADPGFPLGGAHLVCGAPTPDAATSRKICVTKRKNEIPQGGRAPGAPPGFANTDCMHLLLVQICGMGHNGAMTRIKATVKREPLVTKPVATIVGCSVGFVVCRFPSLRLVSEQIVYVNINK